MLVASRYASGARTLNADGGDVRACARAGVFIFVLFLGFARPMDI